MTDGLIRLPDDAHLPLLRARVADVASRVLLVGDPRRARRAAEFLTDVREVGANREYLTFTGSYEGVELTVASHGVGAAGAAVCFEELLRAGAEVLVRVGTAGGLSPQITDGDLVVATGAVRDEGLTPRLVPPEFPAMGDPDLVVALRDLAVGSSACSAATPSRVHTGVVVTSDVFYPLTVLGADLHRWSRAGCLAVEMELSALFVLACLHGARAAGILAVDGSPLDEEKASDMSTYDPHRQVVQDAVTTALEVALDTLVSCDDVDDL